MFHSWKEEEVAERRWKNKWEIALTVYLNSLSKRGASEAAQHLENEGNKHTYKAYIHSISLSYASNSQHISNSPQATTHLISYQYCIFNIYYIVMHLSCNCNSDICLSGWPHEGRILERIFAIEKKCLRDSSSPLHFCSLSSFCPGGHKCITGTCHNPTYSVTLGHTHAVHAYTFMAIRMGTHPQATGELTC